MIEFKFLGLDGDINEGQITQIYVKVGDDIKKGQDLFELEADKLSQPIVAEFDGKIGQINFAIGDIIKAGDVFASSNPSNNVPSSNKSEEIINKQVLSNVMETNPEKSNKKVLATPLARRMARELGIDITTIKGTGPNGRVLKQDLVGGHSLSSEAKSSKLVTKKPLAVVPPMQSRGDDFSSKPASQAEQRVKMTPTRKAISKAMKNSVFTIPHTSLMTQVNVTALVQLRAQLKTTVIKPDFKLTYMPFFIKAVTMALKEFPIINARLDEVTEEIVYHNYYNIGIAADTDAGLIVPVIKDADQQDIFNLAVVYNDLVARVRNKKLIPSEMKDGTFTITNYGSVGLDFGTPVINYPEAAILGIGAIKKTPVVDDSGNIVVNDLLPLSISIDHRIIDGADAGRFMLHLKKLLEAPTSLLISY
ncbi:dihydrolipoamide acetyltransferase family protein [Spiroplasma endosymbiont of Lonchoptera lutea]|uniref:dihydrolipoamide acetyltransferase family protein n=1 Tax=Spiroplasma endosymbiont of Lonchoptera lutea TaxID=3066297 RepID=UPI0030D0A992